MNSNEQPRETNQQIVDQLMQGTWDVFRENLIADYDDRGVELKLEIPTWEDLSPGAKQAWEISMRINEVHLMIGAVMRHIVDQELAQQN